MPDRILVVDDEPDIVKLVSFNLEQRGYDVVGRLSGEGVVDMCVREPISLLVLDLMLPGLSGKEVCRQLKAKPETRDLPVVMLTARDDEIDRVVGFELGAADYVVKPFSVRELILRIEAILRRLQAPPPTEVIMLGNLGIDLDAHRVRVNGQEIHLTRSEFEILRTLVVDRGRVYSRDDLLDSVWGRECEVLDRTVDAHIMRLRKKLGSAARHVETVRGVGYRAV